MSRYAALFLVCLTWVSGCLPYVSAGTDSQNDHCYTSSLDCPIHLQEPYLVGVRGGLRLRHIILSALSPSPPSSCRILPLLLFSANSRPCMAELSRTMSPDTVSSLFPDRPIRPLPKRRLRERLPTEVADSITYPSSSTEVIPLFSYPPYTLKDESSNRVLSTRSPVALNRVENKSHLPRPQSNGAHQNKGADSTQSKALLGARSLSDGLSQATRVQHRQDQSHQLEPQQPSAASSNDGYDSFENTSNKKKRKIPLAGELSVNGNLGLCDINDPVVSPSPTKPTIDGTHSTERTYSGSLNQWLSSPGYIASTQGFSGPGRGRLGLMRAGRSPLRALHDGNNAWPIKGTKAETVPVSNGQFLFDATLLHQCLRCCGPVGAYQ